MRKLVTILLTLTIMMSLIGCSKKEESKVQTSKFTANIDKAYEEAGMELIRKKSNNTLEELIPKREEMVALYGENKEITTNDYDSKLAATTRTGVYVGQINENNVISWKGIPYAKQPIGDLRWKTPEERDDDNRVYEAYYFGHSSIQEESKDELSSLYPQGEDCLNLNVWNNKTDPSDNKPIMVWIHGGGFIQGGSCDHLYEGTHFVENNPDVIYMSIDYRTDILGFINLSCVPGADDYSESGNLGLLDEIAALSIPKLEINKQNKIVNIIESFDKKIELNTRINSNLETIALNYYKKLMADYGTYLNKLSDIAKITMGQSPNGSSYNENEQGSVFYQGRTDFG